MQGWVSLYIKVSGLLGPKSTQVTETTKVPTRPCMGSYAYWFLPLQAKTMDGKYPQRDGHAPKYHGATQGAWDRTGHIYPYRSPIYNRKMGWASLTTTVALFHQLRYGCGRPWPTTPTISSMNTQQDSASNKDWTRMAPGWGAHRRPTGK
jgi:hypothetical protein